MLLSSLAVAFVASLILSLLGMLLLPWFRSGERKEGTFRADQSTGSYAVDARRGARRVRTTRASSSELPLVGGVAMVVAVTVAGITAGILLDFSLEKWELLGVLLIGMLGFGLVGFYDDWRKVQRGVGISEAVKFIGVSIVALASGIALNRLIVSRHLSARFAYPPYSDIPLLGQALVHAKFAWIVFFLLMTVLVATTTALAVDFADGMDGLAGGLLVSASLSFAAILFGEGGKGFDDLWPAAICMLAIAGAAMGYLPFNWPSSWNARNPLIKRRAKIIMGDTGSLALGGLMALVAVITRLEFVLLIIGGVFVLEGLSALISARILVRFFRKTLVLQRFGSSEGFAHTEFPLPFLATPMHHHYDLLNWDRKRLVYGAWLLGAGMGLLGVASTIGTFTWERYLARLTALIVLFLIWQAGPWTRSFFIGLGRHADAPKDAPRTLALYYGFPFRFFGRPLFGRIDITDVPQEVLETPAERLQLWQRMPVFDARAILGYWCYRAGSFEDAQRIWGRLPKKNLEYRPEIGDMLTEVRHTLALEADAATLGEMPHNGHHDDDPFAGALGRDPNATVPAQMRLLPDDPNSTTPGMMRLGGIATRPIRGDESADAGPVSASPSLALAEEPPAPRAPLWSAPIWSATRGPDLPTTIEVAPAATPEAPPPAPAEPLAAPTPAETAPSADASVSAPPDALASVADADADDAPASTVDASAADMRDAGAPTEVAGDINAVDASTAGESPTSAASDNAPEVIEPDDNTPQES
jgi:UDP-N-acetylmuramyl pentapeptide phosphotransferase/UDP-N-acetylglucosamine-1-phosphate transferase